MYLSLERGHGRVILVTDPSLLTLLLTVRTLARR